MSLLTRPLIYDDLAQMPADGKRCEVIDGDLVFNPAPAKKHQRLSARLFDLFLAQQKAGLGEVYFAPVDVQLSSHDIVQPDLIFIDRARLDIYRPNGIVVEPPDLVVEILSPSTRVIDQVRKAALYARAGVPEYWIADPDEPSLTVYVLRDGQYEPVTAAAGTARSLVLPDLPVDLSALCADL